MADTGKTSSPNNRKKYGFKIDTKTAVYFQGEEAIYDSLLSELGLIDLTANPEDFMFVCTLQTGRSDYFATLHVTLVETSAGGDGIVDTQKIKIRCKPDNALTAVAALRGKTINGKQVYHVGIC